MKTTIKSLAVIFLFLATAQSAHAGLLIEPYLGYASGQVKQTTSANLSGTDYGLRAGFSTLGFAVGADYMAAKFTDDSTPKNNFTIGDLGLFVAFKFPVLIRAYATYVPSAKIDADNGSSFTFQKGNVMKLGVGFTGLPFININLEYIKGSYSEAKIGGTTLSLNPDLTTTAYGLSISAPFDLL